MAFISYPPVLVYSYFTIDIIIAGSQRRICEKRFRGFREEVGQAFGPKVLKVLRFDSGFAAEGCGIAAKGGDEYIVSATGFT